MLLPWAQHHITKDRDHAGRSANPPGPWTFPPAPDPRLAGSAAAVPFGGPPTEAHRRRKRRRSGTTPEQEHGMKSRQAIASTVVPSVSIPTSGDTFAGARVLTRAEPVLTNAPPHRPAGGRPITPVGAAMTPTDPHTVATDAAPVQRGLCIAVPSTTPPQRATSSRKNLKPRKRSALAVMIA